MVYNNLIGLCYGISIPQLITIYTYLFHNIAGRGHFQVIYKYMNINHFHNNGKTISGVIIYIYTLW